MKVLIIALLVSGCTGQAYYKPSNNPNLEWLTRSMNPRYASYDPCFQCGEGWGIQIPNKRFEDQGPERGQSYQKVDPEWE